MTNPTIVIVGSDAQTRAEFAKFIKTNLSAAGREAVIDALKSPGGVSGSQCLPIRIKTADSVYFLGTSKSPDEMII